MYLDYVQFQGGIVTTIPIETDPIAINKTITVNGSTQTLNSNPSFTISTGTTTNALTMNNGGAGDASGTTFDGSAARTLSYNTLGAVPTTRTINGTALSSNVTLTLASSQFANQGTTTTVLHGNASGNPSWAQIAIADLSATGTPSSTTYLRGDNTWSTIATGSTTDAPAGYTLHGIGLGTRAYYDTIIYKDTTKSWVGINTTAPAGTLQIYPTFPGTVATTSGSATVTGTNTLFLNNYKIGDSILINGATYAAVLSVASNTSLTLTANFGSTLSGVSHTNPSAARGLLRMNGNGDIFQYGTYLSRSSLLNINLSYGHNALKSLTTGSNLTAFGIGALQFATTAAQCVAIGTDAMGQSGGADAFASVAVGLQAMYSGRGSSCVAIGQQALRVQNSSGANNVAVGLQALLATTSGTANTSLGTFSMGVNTTGSNNIGIGYTGGGSNTTGSNNTYIGNTSGNLNNTGSNNTYIGYGAGSGGNGVVAHTSNTDIGYLAGGNSKGKNNTFIGANATYTYLADSISNYDNVLFFTGKNGHDSIVATTATKAGILTATPNSSLQVAGSFATAYVAKSADYTATVSDYTIEVTAASKTITLPTAVGIAGRQYFITTSGSGTATVATTSSQTFINISGTPTSISLGTFAGVLVQSNGAVWLKVSGF
jgi:hypothetical protein